MSDNRPLASASTDTPGDMKRQLIELQEQNRKLRRINQALVERVESGPSNHSGAYNTFEHSVFLAEQVRERTEALNAALAEIKQSNQALKQANDEAETAHQYLMDAIESIADAFVLYDRERRLLICNSKFRNLWKGSGIDIRPGLEQQQVRSFALRCGLIDRYYDDLEASGSWEKYSLLGDGKVFRLHNGCWLQMSEHQTGDGGLVVLYKDITALIENERARRERALEKKSRVLRNTLDNLAQGVVLVNQHNQLELWNQRFAQWLGPPGETLTTGVDYHLLIRGSLLAELSPSVDTLALEPGSTTSAAAHERKPQELELPGGRVLEVSSHRIAGGETVHTYTDITERRRTAEELRSAYQHLELRVEQRTAELQALNHQLLQAKREAEQANHSKTKFLAAASHDLLQPMNAARLFAASLQEQSLSDKTRQLVAALSYSLEDMESLLVALVDISKLDAGAVRPDRVSFRAQDLLDNLANEYATQAKDQGLKFRFVSSSAVIDTDSQLLARILRNFLSNACRYTNRGRILLGCRRRKRGLSIQVWDTGIGIETGKEQEIFEEFNRLHDDHSSRDKGLGLGLAIVDKMSGVLQHPVGVSSRLGEGSCFWVEVPYGQARPARSQGQGAGSQPTAMATFNGRRILVLDNDPSICNAMETLLTGWGCRVLTALSQAEAAAQLSGQAFPELIIADYHLDDDQNGIDAVMRLTAGRTAPVPVLMITANYSNELKQQLRTLGYRLLNKPVRPAKLKAVVHHLLMPT